MVAGLVTLALAFIWGSVFLHLRQQRAQVERAAWTDASNLARGFGESTLRAIESVDQVMQIIRALYRADPAHFDISQLAPKDKTLNELTLQMSYTDARGMMLGSNLGPSGPVDLSDREHVRVHFGNPEDFLFISKPVLGRVSKKWSIQFTRKLLHADGSFGGVVVISLDPYYFSRFYESLDIGQGSILLVGTDGVIRARAPQADASLGTMLRAAALAEIDGGAESGTYRSLSGVDHVDRLFAWRRLKAQPLAVIVGLAAKDVFAAYEQDRRQLLLIGGALSLFVILLGAFLLRQSMRLLGSQRALGATLENIAQGIIMIDADGTVPVINRRAAELLGLPRRLARPGTRIQDILDWQIETGELSGWRVGPTDLAEGAARGDLGPDLYERTRANGITLEIRTQMIATGGAVRTYTDITERKRTLAALAAARDQAEAASKVRSEFLAVMSHEIRTPMNAVIGMTGLLIDSELSPPQRRFATTLREAAEHLLQIIDDILDFSKLEADRLEFETIPFELNQVVAGVVDMLRVKAEEKGLSLQAHLGPARPLRLIGDPGRLRQVLLNLVSNGVKFTDLGGVFVDVDVAPAADGMCLLKIAVRDTGIGISQDAQASLFTHFSQVDSSISRRFGGTGLGLAICRRLLERLGGTISVDSTPGIGSVFRVEVPYRIDTGSAPPAPAPDSAAPARAAAAPALECAAPATPADKPQLHILLAEDNATNRLVAITRLEMLGHHVDSVEDGALAVQAVQSKPYDLVLMDVMMPVMDGLAATRAIRRLPGPVSHIPIVAVTANVFRHHQEECRAAGMDDFLGKPFTKEGLVRVLERAMTGDLRAAPEGQSSPVQEYRALAARLGSDAARALLDVFATEAHERLAALQSMARAGGPGVVAHQARALYESAATLGLTSIAEAAERLAERPETETLKQDVAALRALLEQVVAACI